MAITPTAVRPPGTDTLLEGQWVRGAGAEVPVLDKFDLTPLTTIRAADQAQTRAAVDAAFVAFRRDGLSPHERGAILDRAATILEERVDTFVETIQGEAGFTKAEAAGESRRSIETLRVSAQEARQLCGEVVPVGGAPDQAGRMAFTLRVPLGVVAAITPFNAPLNTVLHKVAPAFASGNAVILKPSTYTPLTACLVAQILVEAGMPSGLLSVLQGSAAVAESLIDDPRVRFVAFTGSTDVGRQIQKRIGLRRSQMELGSIACTIVCADANLDRAVPKIINAAYRKAGQVCTSIQLLLVHESIRGQIEARLVDEVDRLPYGDPRDARTRVGPVISEASAVRIHDWIQQAVDGGATRLTGGHRERAVVAPALLTNIDDSMKLGCSEVFGPVMSIVPFQSLEDAIARVNATPYGLAAGIFTNQLDAALAAARRLEVGGVHINETSSSRVDLMPYGGSKDSGFGREGPRAAIREMTEERIVTLAAA